MKFILTEKLKLITKRHKIIIKFFFVLMLYLTSNKIIVGQVVICPENTTIDTSFCGTKLPNSLSEITEAPYNIIIEDAEIFTNVYTIENSTSDKTVYEREIIIYNDSNFNFIYDSLEFISSCKFLLPCYNDFSNCHINDWNALKALYESANGDNWKDNTGWGKTIDGQISPPDNCDLKSLFGVYLDMNGRVDYLNLNCNELSGKIPPDLENLSNLKWLDLNDNNLSDRIPANLGNFNKLEYLDLSRNNFNGGIPSELGKLNNLNQFICYRSKLSGSVPSELGNLNKLIKLNLNSNNLSGSIPTELSNLKELKYLSISHNNLTDSIPFELGNLSKLKFLYLSSNELTGSIPKQLGNLSNLTQLNLYGNNLAGNIPPEFNSLSKLTQLDLHRNNLTGNITLNLSNLRDLVKLHLWSNKLTGSIPNTLFKLSKIEDLHLGYNDLSGSISRDIGNLKNLKALNLVGNQLSGSIPLELANLSKLMSLTLSSNNLTGSIPPQIGNLNELTRLSLSNNHLTGIIPANLSKLNKLISINLSNNQLNGNIPIELGDLNELTELYLSNNQLNGEIPELSNLGELTSINLSNNQLTGNIPIQISNLSNPPDWIWNDITLQESDFLVIENIYLEKNYFNCEEIQPIFQQTQQNLAQAQQNFQVTINFNYGPQYFTPSNYENIVSNVFDTLNINQSLQVKVELPWNNENDLIYEWKRNGHTIKNATNDNLIIENILLENVGKYTLHVTDKGCLGNQDPIEFISDPIYVIIKGYDLYGQSAAYDQVMVEFESKENTNKYERSILNEHGGYVADACNCNRELYLWQFPTTEAAVEALLEIDRKKKRIKSKNKPKGGFNNNINIGEANNIPKAYNILSKAFNESYTDSVKIFVLDSGLDNEEDNFLLDNAPVDSCYKIEKSNGYSYVDSTATISTNFSDDLWHGTFGYHSIAEHLDDSSTLRVVPLKIFDHTGKGNLFDMVCAMYHAIDHNADIINISAGYYGEPSDILESAINAAREKGIFITAAAGNDTINIDSQPQYPAYYASQYSVFETIDASGKVKLDSVKYDNVISVASINAQNQLSQFSNTGKESVTIACYGENIHSYGIGGADVIASGTSMSTFFASKALALEITKNKQRAYQQIWNDFETNWLINNPLLLNITQTGKHINFTVEEAIIKGCTNPKDVNYFPFANQDDGSCVTTNIVDTAVDFVIYPNPSNGAIQLSFLNHSNLPKQISVIDCLGKQISSINSSNKFIKINLNAYPKGIYFIYAKIRDKTIIRKLILK